MLAAPPQPEMKQKKKQHDWQYQDGVSVKSYMPRRDDGKYVTVRLKFRWLYWSC